MTTLTRFYVGTTVFAATLLVGALILAPGDQAGAAGNETRGGAVIQPEAMAQPAASTCTRDPYACELARQAF